MIIKVAQRRGLSSRGSKSGVFEGKCLFHLWANSLIDMFGKKKKTLFDHIKDYDNPYNDIEYLVKPVYKEKLVSSEHKQLEEDIEEYFDLIHPMVRDFINSYALLIEKYNEAMDKLENSAKNARRSLTIEQENVQELTDQLREVKKQLASEGVIRRDLEERLKDERTHMQSVFNQEKKTLELLVEEKLPPGITIDEIVKKVVGNVGDSEETERLRKKVEDLEKRLKEEREENERIQEEISTSFMEKMMRSDEIIDNLKKRLGEE